MGGALIVLNGYVHWRILKGKPITWPYALALSVMDLSVITGGIMITSRFENTLFVFYYPALLGVALIFRRRISLAFVTVVAGIYTGMSVAMEPGVDTSVLFDGDEKQLTVRVVSMFAIVVAANLMTRIERQRRIEAVTAERAQAQRNLELQKKAQEAELAAQEERSRIAREIHDGIAQSIYMISLHLETCADLALQPRQDLQERLGKLVALSKETLLEVRHYIFDLKPYLAEGKGPVNIVENQVREFNRVAGVPAVLDTRGDEQPVPVPVATCLYRVTQEALANAFKHARASQVSILLEFLPAGVQLTVQDDGQGFDPAISASGHGLQNMRHRAEELGGTF